MLIKGESDVEVDHLQDCWCGYSTLRVPVMWCIVQLITQSISRIRSIFALTMLRVSTEY